MMKKLRPKVGGAIVQAPLEPDAPSKLFTEESAKLVRALGRAQLAFPRQKLSEEEHTERCLLYVEVLIPRWPIDILVEAVIHGIPSWDFFPTPREIEFRCQAIERRLWALANPVPIDSPAQIEPMAATPEEAAQVAKGLKKLAHQLRTVPGFKGYPSTGFRGGVDPLKNFDRQKVEKMIDDHTRKLSRKLEPPKNGGKNAFNNPPV